MKIERQYHKLIRGPGNRDLKAWFQDFEYCYADVKLLKLKKMKGQRAQRDFFLTVASYEQTYSDNYFLRMSYEAKIFEMLDLIEKFRHLIQLHQIVQINKKTHQAVFFVTGTVLNTENSDGVSTFNGQRPPRPKTPAHACICGWKH